MSIRLDEAGEKVFYADASIEKEHRAGILTTVSEVIGLKMHFILVCF